MGLIAFSTDVGGFDFGKGIMLALFHSVGRNPSRSELLKIAVNGGARLVALSFNTHAGILSGPVALFALAFRNASTVSATLITYWSGNSSFTDNTS